MINLFFGYLLKNIRVYFMSSIMPNTGHLVVAEQSLLLPVGYYLIIKCGLLCICRKAYILYGLALF